jgi:hypothetical protein
VAVSVVLDVLKLRGPWGELIIHIIPNRDGHLCGKKYGIASETLDLYWQNMEMSQKISKEEKPGN